MSFKELLQKVIAIIRKTERYAYLREFQIFERLNHHELSVLDTQFYRRKFASGETLYEKGFPVELVYLISSGEIQLKESQQSYGAGQVLDPASLFGSDKRHSTAVAVSDTEVLAIALSDLNDLINKEKGLGVKVLRNICTLLSHLVEDKPC